MLILGRASFSRCIDFTVSLCLLFESFIVLKSNYFVVRDVTFKKGGYLYRFAELFALCMFQSNQNSRQFVFSTMQALKLDGIYIFWYFD